MLSNLAVAVAEALDEYGVDGRAIVESVGIDFAFALDPDTRISLDTNQLLWERAREVSEDSCFGLSVADRFNPAVLHGLGFSWMASGTLGEAFARVLRFQKLVNTAARFHSNDLGREVDFVSSMSVVGMSHPPAYVLAILAGIVRLCRLTSGQGIGPTRVTLVDERPGADERLEEWFGCPVIQGCREDSLRFPRELLERPILAANPRAARLNDQLVIDYLERLDRGSVVSKAKEKIIEKLPNGRPNQEEIASAMNMSLRNFQRKLQREGTTFRELLDDIRRDLAIRFISDSHRPIGAISYSLGFSEPANFTRAFRGWTGESPRQYREHLRNGGPAGA